MKRMEEKKAKALAELAAKAITNVGLLAADVTVTRARYAKEFRYGRWAGERFFVSGRADPRYGDEDAERFRLFMERDELDPSSSQPYDAKMGESAAVVGDKKAIARIAWRIFESLKGQE